MVLSHLLHLQGIESVVLEAFRLLESVSNGGQPYIKRCAARIYRPSNGTCAEAHRDSTGLSFLRASLVSGRFQIPERDRRVALVLRFRVGSAD
jgi:hypothetical protein